MYPIGEGRISRGPLAARLRDDEFGEREAGEAVPQAPGSDEEGKRDRKLGKGGGKRQLAAAQNHLASHHSTGASGQDGFYCHTYNIGSLFPPFLRSPSSALFFSPSLFDLRYATYVAEPSSSSEITPASAAKTSRQQAPPHGPHSRLIRRATAGEPRFPRALADASDFSDRDRAAFCMHITSTHASGRAPPVCVPESAVDPAVESGRLNCRGQTTFRYTDGAVSSAKLPRKMDEIFTAPPLSTIASHPFAVSTTRSVSPGPNLLSGAIIGPAAHS